MIGEPDAGNPHVRFDEGVQETCSSNAPVPYSTLASWRSLRQSLIAPVGRTLSGLSIQFHNQTHLSRPIHKNIPPVMTILYLPVCLLPGLSSAQLTSTPLLPCFHPHSIAAAAAVHFGVQNSRECCSLCIDLM